MKTVKVTQIISDLAELIKTSLVHVEKAAHNYLEKAAQNEPSVLCKWALEKIISNNEIAVKTDTFACQDCGQAVLFVNVGQQVFVDGDLTIALNKGVEEGYKAARKSVANSIDRKNTGTNTPAVIHYNIVPGENLEIIFLAKGAGSENMSKVFMLTPSDGIDGIISSVVHAVKDAGANPCPPIILGVGIGGTMEKCAILSKLALTRTTGEKNPDPVIAELEDRILKAVNETGIGAQGFGGRFTALAVHIESCPTHIGMLPVAVNFQCHSVRHGKIIY